MDGWHSMGDWGWAMMVFWILLWLALIGLVIWAITEWTGRRGGSDRAEASPREILDRRFAEGKIALEEYDRAREALSRRGEGHDG